MTIERGHIPLRVSGQTTLRFTSYGRAPTFLLATGYEQVRSIAAHLAGDQAAAADVQLHLPETGVCSVDLGAREEAETASLGFPTGSQHGRSGEDSEDDLPATGSCCGAAPVSAGAGVG